MEPAELRANRQQRPLAGSQVPGTGGDLPADGAASGRGGGGRPGHVPPGPRADKAPGKSVSAASAAVRDMFLPTAIGQPGFDFNRFALIEQNRVTQQDLLAQSRGQIAQGLIQTYRALGGGWEISLQPCAGSRRRRPKSPERRAGRSGGIAEAAQPAGAARQPAPPPTTRTLPTPTAGAAESVTAPKPMRRSELAVKWGLLSRRVHARRIAHNGSPVDAAAKRPACAAAIRCRSEADRRTCSSYDTSCILSNGSEAMQSSRRE